MRLYSADLRRLRRFELETWSPHIGLDLKESQKLSQLPSALGQWEEKSGFMDTGFYLLALPLTSCVISKSLIFFSEFQLTHPQNGSYYTLSALPLRIMGEI